MEQSTGKKQSRALERNRAQHWSRAQNRIIHFRVHYDCHAFITVTDGRTKFRLRSATGWTYAKVKRKKWCKKAVCPDEYERNERKV